MASVQCLPISFTLTVRNKVENLPDKCYGVAATRGQSFMQAQLNYQNANTDFNFVTQDLPTSGPYVVAVMGKKKRRQRLLVGTSVQVHTCTPASCEVTPLSFNYNVCSGDKVFLLYSGI